MTDEFVLQENETLVKSGKVSYLAGLYTAKGVLYLTDKRLVLCCPSRLSVTLVGLLTPMLSAFGLDKRIEFETLLSNIDKVDMKKNGILILHGSSRKLNIKLSKHDNKDNEWFSLIQNRISN